MAKVPYIPRSVRTVELRTPRLPHEPAYQEIPQQEGGHSCPPPDDLEATRVPSGPHKGKTLIQMLNDHPGYLLHLREEAFTNDEAFELKVAEFCGKYQHRLERATGGTSASTLWAASICAFRNNKSIQAHVKLGTWVHDVIILHAVDHNQAELLAFEEAQKKFPAPEHQDHSSQISNIPLAQLRRALKAESPGGGR